MRYQAVDLYKKRSAALVITCSDPRFQSAYRQLIDNLDEYYDLIVFPGASKPAAEDKLVLDNIVLLHGLHHFDTVYVFDHVQCGAFGEVNDEQAAHRQMFQAAQRNLKKVMPSVNVVGYLVGTEQAVKL